MRLSPTRRAAHLAGAVSALAILASLSGHTAEPVAPQDVRFGRHPGFWRMALEWAAPTPVEVDREAATVVLAPLPGDALAADIARGLNAVVRHVTATPDGLKLWLRDGVTVEPVAGLDPHLVAIDFRRAAASHGFEPSQEVHPRRRPDAGAPPRPPTASPVGQAVAEVAGDDAAMARVAPFPIVEAPAVDDEAVPPTEAARRAPPATATLQPTNAPAGMLPALPAETTEIGRAHV